MKDYFFYIYSIHKHLLLKETFQGNRKISLKFSYFKHFTHGAFFSHLECAVTGVVCKKATAQLFSEKP